MTNNTNTQEKSKNKNSSAVTPCVWKRPRLLHLPFSIFEINSTGKGNVVLKILKKFIVFH